MSKMIVRHTVRPKMRMPKTAIRKATLYRITADADGIPRIKTTHHRSITQNVNKG